MIHTIHQGSIGPVFLMTLKDGSGVIDLTGKTLQAIFKRPDETVLTVSATTEGPPTAGVAKYVGTDGQFDMVGSWRWQVRATASGEEFWSDVADFEVLPNLVPA